MVRVVTPGTLTEDSLLDARAHNFLAALRRSQDALALAWLDVSTGDFLTGPITDGTLPAELARIAPGELLAPRACSRTSAWPLWPDSRERLTPLPNHDFDSLAGERRLKTSFGVAALDGFGAFSRPELGACGALIGYVELTQKGRLRAFAAAPRGPGHATR